MGANQWAESKERARRDRRRDVRVACFLPGAIPHFLRVLHGILRYQKDEPRLAISVSQGADELTAAVSCPDGIIAAVFNVGEQRSLRASGLPVLNVSNSLAVSGLPRVVSDDLAVGRLAAGHILERGYSHLCYVGWAASTEFGRLRRQGVREAAQQRRRPVLELTLPQPAERDPFLYRRAQLTAVREALRRLPQPCGIVAENDGVAGLLMEAACAAGLPVPAALGIVGVDNLSGGPWAYPWQVSSVELNAEAIGWLAARQLFRLVTGRQRRLRDGRVPPLRLHVRASSDVSHLADPVVERALALLRADTESRLNGTRLAVALHTSRETLQRHFRATLGSTPKAEIARQRLQLAQELLTQTSLKISVVAERCGYAKQSTFASRFRERTGLSPRAYRHRYRVEASPASGAVTGVGG